MSRARTAVAVILASGVLMAACQSPIADADADAAKPVYGTLGSLLAQSGEEAQAGVTAAMIELSWRRAEPSEGTFDEEYLASVRDAITTFRATGRTVTLGLGLHQAPPWVIELPASRFVDDSGSVSEEPNLVFNQVLREAAERYLTEAAAQLDLATVEAVRITAGGNAEVVYPDGGGYWAFDVNAQNGPDLPPSLPLNPVPGWRPGDGGDVAATRSWIEWYVGALDDVVQWQVDHLSTLGFRGAYEVLTPGSGMRPAAYEDAVESNLPAGVLGRGAAWHVFYRQLPQRPDLTAYVSSVADGSGGDDLCTPDDAAVPLDAPETENWSATRWISRVADEYGLRKGGENPGWQRGNPLSGAYVDPSSKGMMAAAFRQVRSCGLSVFYWAHSDQLWNGRIPFSRYADHIARPGD